TLTSLFTTHVRRTLGVAVVLVALCGVTAAQDSSGALPLGQAPGAPAGSYSIGDFDSINFFNGHLNFNLPLITAGGRGGAQHTVPFIYEQKWIMEHYYDSAQQRNIYYVS